MTNINFLLNRFSAKSDEIAIINNDQSVTYGELYKKIIYRYQWLKNYGINNGDAVIIIGDYSLDSVSIFLALIELNCILIPLTPNMYESVQTQLDEVAAKWKININSCDNVSVTQQLTLHVAPIHYETIRARCTSGLVLFTSGSSGQPKAVVHDFSMLLKKFHTSRESMTTLNFLLFDHWGGLNTLLHGLSNLCLIVFPKHRTPEEICKLIMKYHIELLPATPSFLNLLLISKAYLRYNLNSLKIITYGAEPMPASTLAGIRKAFPHVELRQTYGMIELGVLRAKSRSTDSLWVRLGGDGYHLRIVDNMLQIKAESAMLGYINAPSPFTEDGYLVTGDLVEQDGEWLRILGRQSDIINVGGQKVYPAEVEEVLLSHPKVLDAVVYGEKNSLLGKIVCADVILKDCADKNVSKKEILHSCRKNLQSYMIPIKINFVSNSLQNLRLKKIRTRHDK